MQQAAVASAMIIHKMYEIEFVCVSLVNVIHIKSGRSLIIKQSYGKV